MAASARLAGRRSHRRRPRVARRAQRAGARADRAAPDARRPRPAEGARHGGGAMTRRSALVVDDDAHVLEVLEMRLEALGFDVTASADPQAAIQILSRRGF